MFKLLKKLFNKYFDYVITDEYYVTERTKTGAYAYKKRYHKKYFLRCLRKGKYE